MSWQMTGLKAWLLQRVSAVYMAVFLAYFLVSLVVAPPRDYGEWQAWMHAGPMALASAVFFIALLAHAWVGIRDVMLDYIKPFALRVTLLIVLALGLLVMALWAIRILLTAGGAAA
ncbi:succinate dehydrogenase [Candidatus Tenderia electrophaga]|jgi:succinate dehydrogenase / fumarate reductase membrane anchor subunit|uniref:Succinate dehydrogenase hydrophobic membrane anchor subunit n=1 Tax=Candidatus Tenderia electrophaga TaxID=1748243 RepID=A0A0S2TCZ4_9GAMM|nr:succinate dehydrogenase [Candidatus Tenderia electrophaga]